jgi:hypothetical protein
MGVRFFHDPQIGVVGHVASPLVLKTSKPWKKALGVRLSPSPLPMESEQALAPGQSGKLCVPSGIRIVTFALLNQVGNHYSNKVSIERRCPMKSTH